MFERKFTSKPICLTLSCPCHFRAQPAICDAETLVLGPNPQFFLQTFDIYVDLEEVFKLHKEKRSFSFIGRHQHISLKHDLVVGGSRSNPNKNTTWESEGRSRQRMARQTCSFWKDEEKRAAAVAPTTHLVRHLLISHAFSPPDVQPVSRSTGLFASLQF